MFLPGITFTSSRPTASTLSSRADVAMFVGCVGRRSGPLPDSLRTELEQGGWSAQGLFRVEPARLEALLDVPLLERKRLLEGFTPRFHRPGAMSCSLAGPGPIRT